MTAAVATVATTTIVAATMTEPAPCEISASAAERLAALRTPTKTRSRPAHSWKVLSAGLSTTAMFGLVTAMGWPSDADGLQATAAATPTVATLPASAVPVASTVAPLIPVDPATAVPVVIPVAVPVAQPVQIVSVLVASNTTTKSSG